MICSTNYVISNISSFVTVYIDDLLIYSRSWQEHLDHLSRVMRKVNLKLKLSKCHFVRKSVGHGLTPEGLQPNPGKVTAVQAFPAPRNISELHQFLGLTSYYRKFIAKFSTVASPLHHLIQKEVEWNWTKECQQAFESLKEQLISAPVLLYPDFDVDFRCQHQEPRCNTLSKKIW